MPQLPDDKTQTRLRAVLGIDAETFARTNVGQYIFDRIANEEERLIEDLIMAALGSKDLECQRIAVEIEMRRRLPIYINEAIESGHAAEATLRQMEDHQEY